MKKLGLVIQPYNEKYNKRFDEVIRPAMEKCGLFPYRVDRDSGSMIPMASFEEKIKETLICIAEISTDNPNVWYEVGYAMALNVPVILVCSDERQDYPFDVRHRNILRYATDSRGDYERFEQDLITRIRSCVEFCEYQNEEEMSLSEEEKKIIFFCAKHQVMPNQIVSQNFIENNTINKEDFILNLRRLINKGYIQYNCTVEDGVVTGYCQLMPKAEAWLNRN